jgi:hypothetical protein
MLREENLLRTDLQVLGRTLKQPRARGRQAKLNFQKYQLANLPMMGQL